MTFPSTISTFNAQDTEAAGAALALCMENNISLPKFVALFGDLGVGKTAFVRGFTCHFSKDARVKSPTFALVNQYKCESTSIFHFDMYRIESEDELYSIGFYDYIDAGICLVEWSENIVDFLPDSYIRVEIIKNDNSNTNSRLIKMQLISG